MRALRVLERNARVYRHMWRGSLFTSFLQPALFLGGMGLGLGSLVDRGGAALPGDVPFLQFLAPGLLAAACMQTATSEASYPVTGKMVWHRNYDAMTATPIRPSDLVLGELAWIGLRLSAVAAVFVIVAVGFGALPWGLRALMAVLAAVLTGLAFAAPVMAYAGTLKTGQNFNLLFRFVVTPLFLFSGVFFPISRLPGWLEPVAGLTPLYHGVALTRGLLLDTLAPTAGVLHAAYLVVLTVAGVVLAARIFERRLQP